MGAVYRARQLRLDREVAASWLPVFAATLGFRDGFTAAERQAYEDALRRLDDELQNDAPELQSDAPLYALEGPPLVEALRALLDSGDVAGRVG